MKKIDFVVPWVNGNDTKWQAKKKKYALNNDQLNEDDGNSNVRFRDYGTLKYVFRSIDQYTPWVHKVYLITDKQVPEWLNCTNEKVEIIDHTQIIDSKFLPVFNSNVIDWNIDNIPNLSEYFVYFNDDTLINKSLKPVDFFKNGKPRDSRLYTDLIPSSNFDHIVVNNDILINKWLHRRWPISKKGLWNKSYSLKRIKNLIFLLQIKKSGVIGYIEPHGPISFTKSAFQETKRIWSLQINQVYSHRFRSEKDVSIWLVRHYQLESGNFEPISDRSNYYNDLNNIDKIKYYMLKSKSNTICINDDSKIANYSIKVKKINQILEMKFPKKSSFEK